MGWIGHYAQGSVGNLCTEQIRDLMQHVWDQFGFERAITAEQKLLAVSR